MIAAGRGSAPYLQRLAEEGGGRYYRGADIQDLPQMFLKETIQAAGRYIVEEPFYPLQTGARPSSTGSAPAACPGCMATTAPPPRAAPGWSLISPQGDPVLAQWQYGLGRAVGVDVGPDGPLGGRMGAMG